ALIDTIRVNYSDRKISVLFSAIEGKALASMVGMLLGIAEDFNVTHFDFPKALSMKEIYETVGHSARHKVSDCKLFIEVVSWDMLLVTGSLYFISEVKQHFNSK